jgi:hypothetical protein
LVVPAGVDDAPIDEIDVGFLNFDFDRVGKARVGADRIFNPDALGVDFPLAKAFLAFRFVGGNSGGGRNSRPESERKQGDA